MQQMLGNIRGHIALSQVQRLLSDWFAIDMINFIKEGQSKFDSMSTKDVATRYLSWDVRDIFKYLKDNMMNASREVWRCDPTNHIHGIQAQHFDSKLRFI